jgi:hypothetical protein
MSLSRSINRFVAKQTYDPELEKQLAAEKQKAREQRTKLRASIDELIRGDNKAILDGKLTPQGATQSAALFKTVNDWLSGTPDATADEIIDKGQELLDKLGTIYREDNNRLYFYAYLKTTETQLTYLKTQNLISEEIFKKTQAIVERELKWLEKNQTESIVTYKAHLDTASKEITDILQDPEVVTRMKNAQSGVKMEETTKELDAKKEEVQRAADEKEKKEKATFNIGRFFSKITSGVFTSFWIALALALAILGGSLASNMAIVRPLPYRILFFTYGFFFFPLVIIYFIIRYFQGFPPYFASYLIPLYEYDPLKETRDSFLQKLLYFKTNPVLEEARNTFQAAADSVKDMSINFSEVAKQILEEQASKTG